MSYFLTKLPLLFSAFDIRSNKKRFLILVITLLVIWIVLINNQINSMAVVSEYFGFFFLGIAGAIAANSTGAGGGVVFVPSFQALGIEMPQVIATSFAIQCFGMTVGSLSWLAFFNGTDKQRTEKPGLLYDALLYSAPFSILGLCLVQYAGLMPIASIHVIFSVFSLIFGLVVLFHCFYLGARSSHRGVIALTKFEAILIAFCSFIGGIITAWISVGVGEILAVILLLRGFSVMFSVAAGVIVSAITVIAGVPLFIEQQLIVTEVLLFAAPGAMVGGVVARYIAQALGAKKLKFLLGTWILMVGILGIS